MRCTYFVSVLLVTSAITSAHSVFRCVYKFFSPPSLLRCMRSTELITSNSVGLPVRQLQHEWLEHRFSCLIHFSLCFTAYYTSAIIRTQYGSHGTRAPLLHQSAIPSSFLVLLWFSLLIIFAISFTPPLFIHCWFARWFITRFHRLLSCSTDE